MSGAELKTSEFAYLLATLNASAVVGLDDPALFPAKSSARDVTYGQGRKELEINGWLKPVPDHPEEYELNPALLEIVSIVAAPDFVVATTHSTGEAERQLVLHYLAGDGIVELSAPAEGIYQVGVVLDREALHERIAEMLHLTTALLAAQFTIDETVFKDIQSLSQKGRLERAEELLESAGVNGAVGESLMAAVASPASGQIVVIRPSFGQIESGRRATVFGEDDAAWLVKRTQFDAQNLEIATCDPASIGTLVTEWLDELSD